MKIRIDIRRWAVTLSLALVAGCTALQPETDLRARRVEQAVVPMARAALAAGQVETARRLYTRLLDLAPDAVDARMGLGDVALATGRPARAATWYLDAANLAEAPSARHAALLAHGRASVDAGNLDAARTSFERLVSADERARAGDAAWGHNGVALVAMLEGDPLTTVAALERAVLLDPDEQRFRDNLARAVSIADAYRVEHGLPDTDAEPPVAPSAPERAVVDAEVATTEEEALLDGGEVAEPVSIVVDATPAGTPMPIEAEPEVADGEPARGGVEAGVSADATVDEPAIASSPDTPPAAVPSPAVSEAAFLVAQGQSRFLQVGAFAVEANALRLAERLPRLTDLPVHIEPIDGAEKPIHRVRIGPLPSGSDVPMLMKALRDDAAMARRTAGAGHEAAAAS